MTVCGCFNKTLFTKTGGVGGRFGLWIRVCQPLLHNNCKFLEGRVSPTHPFNHPSIPHPTTHPSIRPSTHPSSVYPPTHPSIHLSSHPSILLSCICPPIRQSTHPSVHLSFSKQNITDHLLCSRHCTKCEATERSSCFLL